MRLEKRLRDDFHDNKGTFGNLKIVIDVDVQLDDLIHEKDEWEDVRMVEQETRGAREQ